MTPQDKDLIERCEKAILCMKQGITKPIGSQEALETMLHKFKELAMVDLDEVEKWHPEHQCEKCGGKNLLCWYADNDVWNQVAADKYGVLCPICFADVAESKGIRTSAWRMSMEGDEPEVNKLRQAVHALKQSLNIHEITDTCPTCGSLCGIASSDDGTRYYQPLQISNEKPKINLLEVEKLVNVVGNYTESYMKGNKKNYVERARKRIGYTTQHLNTEGEG